MRVLPIWLLALIGIGVVSAQTDQSRETLFAAIRSGSTAEVERQLFEGHPAVISSLGQWALAIVTLGIGYLVYWVKSRSVLYTLTTQRIQVERGLFSTIKASVELFRIDDFEDRKSVV